MWKVYIFLNLVVLHHTVSSSPPSPISVNFSSLNLRNLVQWIPGNGTPTDTHFTVQYAIYGDSMKGSKGKRVHWRAVQQCTDIERRWCDLSSETWDQEQGYYARVRAVGRRGTSKWVMTGRRFDPKTETSFGPPVVSVEVKDSNAIITLKGPMRYQPDDHTAISMATLYPQMTYSLFIQNTRRNQIHHFPMVLNPYNYHQMDHETEYCFSAKASLASLPVLCHSSEWHCITTPKDPVTDQLQRVVWGIVVPSLCICVLVVVGYFLRNYLVGKGQKSPGALSQRSFHPCVTPLTPFPPEKLNHIISVTENNSPFSVNTAISDSSCSKQHNTAAPPRYSPQRPETPAEPDDVSVDYGVVVSAPKISEGEAEEAREKDDRGDNGNNLQKCLEDSYEKKELIVKDGHSTRDNCPWTTSYLTQGSTHTSVKTLLPVHAEREVSALAQVQAWASVLLSQIQGSLLSTTKEEVDRESLSLFLTINNQAGLIHIPLPNQQKKEEAEMGENDGKVRVRTDGKEDGAVEEESESEEVALLSACASKNINYVPNLCSVPSEFLPKVDGDLSLATANSRETDSDKEEDGTVCINLDPETRIENFRKQGGLRELVQELEGCEDRMGGEEGEVNAMKSVLKLENVFVRQSSGEAAEALREMERKRESGGEEDILTKWDLVIALDE